MPEFLLNFFRLTRPLSNTKNVLIAFLALFLSGGQLNWVIFILSIISVSLVFSANYAFNTLSDFEQDKENKNKIQYSKAVEFFGQKQSFFIFSALAGSGILLGFFINYAFVLCLTLILLAGYLYSSRATRFKEKAIFDVLISGAATISLRFAAFWFVVQNSLPPLLPVLALICAKIGGYILYKEYDRKFLPKRNRSIIAVFNSKSIIIISALFFLITVLFFIVMCVIGELPFRILFLLPLGIIPIFAAYMKIFNKINTENRKLRAAGFAYALLVLFSIYFIIK